MSSGGEAVTAGSSRPKRVMRVRASPHGETCGHCVGGALQVCGWIVRGVLGCVVTGLCHLIGVEDKKKSSTAPAQAESAEPPRPAAAAEPASDSVPASSSSSPAPAQVGLLPRGSCAEVARAKLVKDRQNRPVTQRGAPLQAGADAHDVTRALFPPSNGSSPSRISDHSIVEAPILNTLVETQKAQQQLLERLAAPPVLQNVEEKQQLLERQVKEQQRMLEALQNQLASQVQVSGSSVSAQNGASPLQLKPYCDGTHADIAPVTMLPAQSVEQPSLFLVEAADAVEPKADPEHLAETQPERVESVSTSSAAGAPQSQMPCSTQTLLDSKMRTFEESMRKLQELVPESEQLHAALTIARAKDEAEWQKRVPALTIARADDEEHAAAVRVVDRSAAIAPLSPPGGSSLATVVGSCSTVAEQAPAVAFSTVGPCKPMPTEEAHHTQVMAEPLSMSTVQPNSDRPPVETVICPAVPAIRSAMVDIDQLEQPQGDVPVPVPTIVGLSNLRPSPGNWLTQPTPVPATSAATVVPPAENLRSAMVVGDSLIQPAAPAAPSKVVTPTVADEEPHTASSSSDPASFDPALYVRTLTQPAAAPPWQTTQEGRLDDALENFGSCDKSSVSTIAFQNLTATTLLDEDETSISLATNRSVNSKLRHLTPEKSPHKEPSQGPSLSPLAAVAFTRAPDRQT